MGGHAAAMMKACARKQEPPPIGRRGRSRLRTRLPARLITVNGQHEALLADISLTGAQVLVVNRRGIAEPLRQGQDAVLQWNGFEAFGTIAWAESDQCGIAFEDMLSPQTVLDTRDAQDHYSASAERRRALLHNSRDWAEGRD